MKFGSLAGLFYAVQKLNAVANAAPDLSDTIYAAAVTGATTGAFSEPSLPAFVEVSALSFSP